MTTLLLSLFFKLGFVLFWFPAIVWSLSVTSRDEHQWHRTLLAAHRCCFGEAAAVPTHGEHSSRRRMLTTAMGWMAVVGPMVLVTQPAIGIDNVPSTILSAAARTTPPSTSSSVVSDLESARNTLKLLLENWEKAVIDCTYADVPRELLEQRNKELLLEKAATSALFDKSASVTSCKTTNRIVRDYLGATGKGPLVGIEKKLRLALELVVDDSDVVVVEGDAMDTYVQTMELVEQELAKARSLSYTAGVADFSAVNNFAQAEKKLVLASTSDSNLEQTRQTIVKIVSGLDKLLQLISSG